MNFPIEIISLIFSYLKTDKCYRCNKTIYNHDDYSLMKHDQKTLKFCSMDCCEYQHY